MPLLAAVVENHECAITITDIDELGLWVTPDVVGIVEPAQVVQQLIRDAVKQFERAIIPVGHSDLIRFSQKHNASRLVQAADAPQPFAGCEVNDFQCVIAEGGDKQSVALNVRSKVIETPFDARQWNRLGEPEHVSRLSVDDG
ncbi:MAG TPA: hypothetical protein VEL06_13340 [Haliangiales bacterium]|nr:hypothetical protein [Haliangiales bacterium]